MYILGRTSWANLPAEVAVCAFLHVFREVRANAVPFLIDNPKLFQLTHGSVDALGGAFQQRLVLWMLQRCSEDSRHFIYDSIAKPEWASVLCFHRAHFPERNLQGVFEWPTIRPERISHIADSRAG